MDTENKKVIKIMLPFTISVIVFIILAATINTMNELYPYLGVVFIIGAIISIVTGLKVLKQ